MTHTTVVLGWDGLDARLLEEFGLGDRFGSYRRSIDTIENDVIGEPHTDELWPTIITGEPPASHGIRAATPGDSIQWQSRWLQTAATVTNYTLPASVRVRIGGWLMDRGKDLEGTPDYFREREIETVFDDRRSKPISVPNYRSETDRLHSLEYDRSELWGDLVAPDESGGHERYATAREIEERVTGAAHRRLGLVEASLAREYDLVFCWFGYVDSIGHVAPLVEEAGWQERHYRRVARWTEQVRELLDDDDELLVVSDHGLREGDHTHDAVLSGTAAAVEDCASVLDVQDVVETVATRRDPVDEPPLRPRHRHEDQKDGRTASRSEVEDRLSDLGYI